MGQIRDIMEKNVITIENDKTAQDAAKIIAEKDISFLVIMNEGNPKEYLVKATLFVKLQQRIKKQVRLRFQKLCHTSFGQ